jgi:small-conductance mechanosensitive channel/CRP-like cAMP-binding protein
MPWENMPQLNWSGEFPITTIAFIVLAVIVMRSARAERRSVLRTAGFYATAIIALFAREIFLAIGRPNPARYLSEYAIVVIAICLIHVSSLLLFRVISPRLGLYPPRILQDVLFVVVLVIFGLVRLTSYNVDATNIFTTSALITAVIALSLQDTLGNILGGLALQLDRSIQVGDWVEIERVAGQVVEIGWRQTSIETNNWETIVVPNSVLVKNRVLVLGRRMGRPIQHRRWIPFYVDSHHPPDAVLDAVQSSLRTTDIPNCAKEPAPQCFLLELAESPARYAVSYWLTDLTAMNPTDSGIRVQTFLALKRIGISIAVPGRNVLMTEDTSEKRQLREEQERAQRMVALRTVDIFRGFSVDELSQLAEHLQPAPYLAGDTLVRQGAEAIRLYIIVEGRADVVVQNDLGERAKLAELGPGDFFGEMGLLTGEPRTATVIARTAMLVYRLDKESFRELIVSRPDVAEQISTILAKRRSELEAIREGLDADAMAARAAANRHDIRQKIWQFFGLED